MAHYRPLRENEKEHPPVGVKAVQKDGTEHPLETTFVGVDQDGIQQWAIDIPPDLGPIGVHAEIFPGKTGLVMKFPETGTFFGGQP